MADISKITLPDGSTRDIKDSAVRDRVTILEQAELEKGRTAKQYNVTLLASDWSSSGTYMLALTELKCGDGTVSPLIAPANSAEHEEYDKIASASATAGEGIEFTKTGSATMSKNIDIIITNFNKLILLNGIVHTLSSFSLIYIYIIYYNFICKN